jgi:hypothetical protein
VRVTAFYQDITRVKADIFIAAFTAEVRPPRGLVGKVDWYLGGFISRQILEGTLHGGSGEMTLVALGGKLLTPKLLLLGLGGGAELRKEDASRLFRRIGQAVRDLKLTSVALEIPLIETPKSGTYEILQETLAGFRLAYRENDAPVHCEVQILSRTEVESEGWRRVIRGLPR